MPIVAETGAKPVEKRDTERTTHTPAGATAVVGALIESVDPDALEANSLTELHAACPIQTAKPE